MELREVHTGRHGNTRWVMTAGEAGEYFATFLKVYGPDGEVRGETGFAGERLYPGNPLRASWGGSDSTPVFVKARTAPEIDQVIVETDQNEHIDLDLSDVVAEFDLRFGAAALPAGHSVATVTALSRGTVVARIPT
ncbi:hypothetical protein ACIBL5_06345 [Streptomyces sp. NPDC050516]|uniref:hypothetical protein n=1 Tax=Streptomyces sp. NPDC050516 TaxID=3365621 RepID=UPI00379D0A6C